jgi:hypothetical protein
MVDAAFQDQERQDGIRQPADRCLWRISRPPCSTRRAAPARSHYQLSADEEVNKFFKADCKAAAEEDAITDWSGHECQATERKRRQALGR